ncbi:hypothetical protein G7046_g1579 [Stylonectria norvegica]|nr:hypothetical protein G7046_g1579 [Stylonectria norvegica]
MTIHRVLPTSKTKQRTVCKLSILDATVARFSSCSAIWFYDRTEQLDLPCDVLFGRLRESLGLTLNEYPHLAGQLQWATKELVAGGTNARYLGRPVVVYGTADDPGVELHVVEDERDLSDIVPSREDRSSTKKTWDATDLPQHDLVPATVLALSALASFQGLPSVAIQLTAFKCGGFSVGIKIAHSLSDAACLLHFMNSWAIKSQALKPDTPLSSPKPVANPILDFGLVDRVAGLTEDGKPTQELTDKARALPLHRFDWWAAEAPGYPSWALPSSLATMPPTEELKSIDLSPSTYPPWPTWDLTAPVKHAQIRFTAGEISNIKEAAALSLPGDLETQRISKHDSVLAHIWLLINRARQLDSLEEPVYLDITLGLRSRVGPPLPDSFAGSPILLAYVSKTGAEATNSSLGDVAGSIRQMMTRFTPDAVAAYIHDAAHEPSPQRLWQAFLGSRHILVTSWVRLGAYEVDFRGTGGLARYVQGVMPRMDGLVQIIDIGETGELDVSVCLVEETMDRLLADPMLRAFEG